MKELKFVKETSGRWYVELPDWTGPKSDLEMVCGADTMLDYISEGEYETTLIASENDFSDSNKLTFIKMADELGNGAFYKIEDYKGLEFSLEMWLCDVLKFVFGGFPEVIYFARQGN